MHLVILLLLTVVLQAKCFVSQHSLVDDAYNLKTDKELINTLEENIRERGVMEMLLSECAKAKMNSRVQDILDSSSIA
jgi:hypothetical protein